MPHLGTLLLQIALIITFARLVGYAFRWIGQPQVVGEMVAGIMLGPSLLGWVAPGLSVQLFPPESLGALSALSQIGLIAFMFLIGLELDTRLIRGLGETALLTSHVSIAIPFFLGSLLALFLYPRLSDDGVSFTAFALFLGTAMSVTAFPVLARILAERRLLSKPVGALTIACAAVDDVTAWCILAAVVMVIRAGAGQGIAVMIGGAAVYVVVMLFLVRPAATWFARHYQRRRRVSHDFLGMILLLVLVSAWFTEWLGIHALFGAFLMGVMMPRDEEFVHAVRERLEDLVVVLLLPLFFAFMGLRTRIGLLDGQDMWLFFALVTLVAVAGKLGGSMIAARSTGLPWREAGAVGILMNTRGLMQLVVLNVGLDIGVISPPLFAMLVLMALVTTFMTTPLLAIVYPAAARRSAPEPAPEGIASTSPQVASPATRL